METIVQTQPEYANVKAYKYSKESYLALRNQIKELSAAQTALKPQRKEDQNLRVARTTNPDVAISTVYKNGKTLRLMYIVYDEIRGKDERVTAEKSRLNVWQKKDLTKLSETYLK